MRQRRCQKRNVSTFPRPSAPMSQSRPPCRCPWRSAGRWGRQTTTRFCNLRQVPRKHCQSVPVKKPRWTWEVLVGIKLKFPLRIVTKTVPRKNCEYGSGGHSDGGKGYDSAHGHGGGWDDKTSHFFQMLNKLHILDMDMIMEGVMGREEGVVMTITGR